MYCFFIKKKKKGIKTEVMSEAQCCSPCPVRLDYSWKEREWVLPNTSLLVTLGILKKPYQFTTLLVSLWKQCSNAKLLLRMNH